MAADRGAEPDILVVDLPRRGERRRRDPLRREIGRQRPQRRDQTLLPARLEWLACHDVDTLVEAIRSLRVRGAPAIGIAGGYGVAVAAAEAVAAGLAPAAARAHVAARGELLAAARPTAVNLRWAVERVLATLRALPSDLAPHGVAEAALAAAREIHDEDIRLCAAIGGHGADVLPDGGVLTHCNTGALATGGNGTALAVITTAWDRGRRFEVFADETRPLFQGARLTAWELVQRGIPVTVLVDAAAGQLLRTGRVAACIVGADRIAANGDTANKIGTYALAVLARAHGVPFFVAAPSSTFDLHSTCSPRNPPGCRISLSRRACGGHPPASPAGSRPAR